MMDKLSVISTVDRFVEEMRSREYLTYSAISLLNDYVVGRNKIVEEELVKGVSREGKRIYFDNGDEVIFMDMEPMVYVEIYAEQERLIQGMKTWIDKLEPCNLTRVFNRDYEVYCSIYKDKVIRHIENIDICMSNLRQVISEIRNRKWKLGSMVNIYNECVECISRAKNIDYVKEEEFIGQGVCFINLDNGDYAFTSEVSENFNLTEEYEVAEEIASKIANILEVMSEEVLSFDLVQLVARVSEQLRRFSNSDILN